MTAENHSFRQYYLSFMFNSHQIIPHFISFGIHFFQILHAPFKKYLPISYYIFCMITVLTFDA